MTLEERVSRLERANRRWRSLAFGLSLVLATILSCSGNGVSPPTGSPVAANAAEPKPAAIQDTLRARRLEIVDDQGKTQGMFCSMGEYGSMLSVADSDGENTVVLLAGPRSSSLSLANPSLDATITEAGMSLTPANAEKRAARRRFMATVSRVAREGRPLSADEVADREASLKYVPSAVFVGLTAAKGGMVSVSNPSGETVVSALADKNNAGAVCVYDFNGKPARLLSGAP